MPGLAGFCGRNLESFGTDFTEGVPCKLESGYMGSKLDQSLTHSHMSSLWIRIIVDEATAMGSLGSNQSP